MAEIQTDWVTLQVGDGTTMRAYVARPQIGRPRVRDVTGKSASFGG
ncbi:MAG: hypothetical protein ABSA41_19995 [Terriglobia bacterium]|jgi:hypothetical protein